MFSLPPEQVRPSEVFDQEGRVLLEKTRDYPFWIHQRVVMRTQAQIQACIMFLEEQLETLDHYLPETYQFLMAELDRQQRDLVELKLKDFYSSQINEQQNTLTDSRD